MQICIIGSQKFQRALEKHLEKHPTKIHVFNNIFEALIAAIGKNFFFHHSIIEESPTKTAEQSTICLLKNKFPKIQIHILNLYKVTSFNFKIQKPKSNPKNFKIHQYNLNQKEAELFKLLYKFKGKIISKESLLEAIWGRQCKYKSKFLSPYIRKIKSKLPKDSVQIKSVHNKGYMLSENFELN